MRIIGVIVFLLLASCQTAPLDESNSVKKITRTGNINKKLVKKPQFPARKISNSSQNTPERDGAPEGPLPTHFKKVKPKSEPLSRYGNPDTYQVNGEKFEVMTSSSGYRARGIASWYGTKFHKKRTSSGEDYNLYGLTAAHKTLPLPTYVRVKNLSNGKQAIVKVNDRGPFHSDRIIDLSYGAAVKLGLLPKGTAPVEIEALTTKNHTAHYYLQAGAFSSKDSATTLKAKLAKLTPSPVVIEKYKEFFVVTVGPFANKQMSDGLKNTLLKNGIKGSFSVLR
ncbi:rare lipoprotein A [Legionella adelaidensis]|uniref:Endolytic peptidoglycan transglycosylase RlpA n=1 Tax=Legionella adelaidensis TaxID=45056 RepID=A0A0W0R488_9GAMM|nr:septal ring lytic transglycosylase RlpA family protein [Legionella adelaidensis]KTC65875.1 rare lipoprotein A [Legionella adelaidensis]